jgi:hypothetical protein
MLMSSHGNAPEVKVLAPGVMKDLCVLGAQAIPTDLSPKEAEVLLGEKKGSLVKAIRAAAFGLLGNRSSFQIAVALDNCLEEIASWRKFFREHLEMETDFFLRMPRLRKGASQSVIVCPGVTPLNLWRKCEEQFPCATEGIGDDMDFWLSNVTSKRVAEESAYGVWIIDDMLFQEFEAFAKAISDAGKSAESLDSGTLGGITLEERLLFELKYFRERGSHAPKAVAPRVCLGSHYFGGTTPTVSITEEGKFLLSWCHAHGTGRQIIL